MKSIEIKGSLREAVGKTNAREIRKQEEVPCVLYGKGENVHFKLTEKSFKELVFTPTAYLINLDIEGKKYNAVMRDLQFHPVSDKIIHADFFQIEEKSPVWMQVPIILEGVSPGVLKGGKLIQKMRKLKVKGIPSVLPDEIKINISILEIGKSIKVGDLSLKDLELLDPKNTVVVRVMSARGALAGEETVEAIAETEEKAEEASENKE